MSPQGVACRFPPTSVDAFGFVHVLSSVIHFKILPYNALCSLLSDYGIYADIGIIV